MSYTVELENKLRANANEAQAGPMSAYMQGHFPFLGIKSPQLKELVKSVRLEHGEPAAGELKTVVRELWSLPEREFQYAALLLLERGRKSLQREDIALLEELVTTKSWWDTVDLLASHVAGSLLRAYPELIPDYTERWIASDNMWLQRTALLFQLGYKQRTDVPLLFGLIERCRESQQFFIRKAIGWALREYSKTDPDAVRQFVAETALSPLSKREALKVIERKAL